MRFFKHRGRYYLKKIQKGYMTTFQVAEILNTSIDIVNSAYEEYCKEQNPFKKTSFDFKNAVIQIAISIISTILVLLTLFEMQAGRNATYLPDISLSNTKVAISWDENGLPCITQEVEDMVSKIADKDTIINELPQIKVYNIGVGTAKNISFNWDNQRNIKAFMDILNPCDDIALSYDSNILNIQTPDIKKGIGTYSEHQFDFLLNSTQEFETFAFPLSYYTLIKESYIRTDTKEIPTLYLLASYSDIQGEIYNKTIKINANINILVENPDGSGFCIFTLNSVKENETMNSINLSNLDSDTLMAITSIFAVIISIISIIFTVIFSVQQLKHNRNSVKPISSIQVSDYEDDLAVFIKNVGTGPLTIRKIVFKNEHQESSCLRAMMPAIGQRWTDYTDFVDGWTIPVGGQITFLELQNPKNEGIKLLLRKTLSKITVTLEYVDIYNTKFHDMRTLDFFGRHFDE